MKIILLFQIISLFVTLAQSGNKISIGMKPITPPELRYEWVATRDFRKFS